MNLLEGFTRRETIALIGTTSNRLQDLERAELIIPKRIGISKKPTVLYTWEQILEIRAIKNLRQEVSLQTIKKIIYFLDKEGCNDNHLINKQLIVINDDVFWIKNDWSDVPSVIKIVSKKGKDGGQYVLLVIPALIQVVKEIWEAAEKSSEIDFESFKQRAKASAEIHRLCVRKAWN